MTATISPKIVATMKYVRTLEANVIRAVTTLGRSPLTWPITRRKLALSKARKSVIRPMKRRLERIERMLLRMVVATPNSLPNSRLLATLSTWLWSTPRSFSQLTTWLAMSLAWLVYDGARVASFARHTTRATIITIRIR